MGQRLTKRKLAKENRERQIEVPPKLLFIEVPPDPRLDDATQLYHPLRDREVRILHLEPGERGSPLRGSFRYATLPDDNIAGAIAIFGDDASSVHATRGAHTVADSGQDQVDSTDDLPGSTLPSMGNYEAVSYAWGEANYVHEIAIGTHSARLTDSLHTALQHLRLTNRVRNVWADAVCIDQSNDVEKSAQVANMAQTYKHATAVIIWIGDSATSDALAYRAIQVLSSRPFAQLDGDMYGERKSNHQEEFKEVLENVRQKFRDQPYCSCCETWVGSERKVSIVRHVIPSISRLLERSWFTRLWVVQEVVCRLRQTGVHVYCGTHKATFRDLRTAIKQLRIVMGDRRYSNLPDNETSRFYSAAMAVADNVFGWEYDNSSSQLFWRRYVGLIDRQCSNPRDRVYAIRSFSGIGRNPSLLPDYTVPVRELYCNFTFALMVRQTFEFGDPPGDDVPWVALSLAVAEVRPAEGLEMPSWVPDLHSLTARSVVSINRHVDYHRGFFFNETHFPADSRYFQTMLLPGDQGLLAIRGRCFAKVESVSLETLYPDRHTTHRTEDLATWYETCKAFASPILLENARPSHAAKRFHYLLSSGQRWRNYRSQADRYHQLRDRLLVHWQAELEASEPYDQESSKRDIGEFAEDIYRRPSLYKDRVLCRTRNEHGEEDIACLPATAQVGDKLCIFGGCPYPLLVRDDGNGSLKLVSDAYISRVSLAQALGVSGTGPRATDSYLPAQNDYPFLKWEDADEVEYGMAGDRMLTAQATQGELLAQDSGTDPSTVSSLGVGVDEPQWLAQRNKNAKLIMGLGWMKLS